MANGPCPFHPDNDGNINDCYYCRMHWSKVKLAYTTYWTTPEDAGYTDEYIGESGIPVTPTIERDEDVR